MLFRSLLVSAFLALAAATEAPKTTVTSTTRVYVTLHPSATGSPSTHNVTAPTSSGVPTQFEGAGSMNAVPVVMMGAAAAVLAVLV
ncbi:hypothetical protein EX30DRAFT_344650 [Ascodesmis nigricans]|uniref:Uncharacterized protein n=1 Tax=Ascodesmis nigricans TaxID=341454 RepID=A0A4S2MNH0_9PEZI|nr:hypothetical protein EX30DRAFT_344650 [Ascodesmis nigricans]